MQASKDPSTFSSQPESSAWDGHRRSADAQRTSSAGSESGGPQRTASLPNSTRADACSPPRAGERKHVLLEGPLDKRGKHNVAWKGRFFALCRTGAFHQETRLLYFSSEADRLFPDRARGSIPIDHHVTVSEGAEDEGRFSIFLVVPKREGFPDRTFVLGAPTDAIRRQWTDALALARSRMDGRVMSQSPSAASPASPAADFGLARVSSAAAAVPRRAASAAAERVLVEGPLSKRGLINPAWKPRFCAIFDRSAAAGGPCLRYFEREADKFNAAAARGEVPLAGAAAAAGAAERGRFLFSVSGSRAAPGRTYVLAAASEEERARWLDALVAATAAGSGDEA
jgi:hypothetical protein